MNFKLDLSAFSRKPAIVEAETFDQRRRAVLINHADELTISLRAAAILMMTDLWELDKLLDDQDLGDKVLAKNTRHTFKYFCAGYSHEEAGEDPRILTAFELFGRLTQTASEILTGHRGSNVGPVGHALHSFGYKIVPSEPDGAGDWQTSIIVGRNFRIVYG